MCTVEVAESAAMAGAGREQPTSDWSTVSTGIGVLHEAPASLLFAASSTALESGRALHQTACRSVPDGADRATRTDAWQAPAGGVKESASRRRSTNRAPPSVDTTILPGSVSPGCSTPPLQVIASGRAHPVTARARRTGRARARCISENIGRHGAGEALALAPLPRTMGAR